MPLFLRSSAVTLLAVLSISLLLNSCKKDEDFTANPQTPGGNGNVSATFVVQVLDQNESPISDVTVTLANVTEQSAADGTCVLSSASFPSGSVSLNVKKSGFFERHLVVNVEDGTHFLRIKLSPAINAGSFNSAMGGTINIPNGGSLVFPSNAIEDLNGNAYSGIVNVSAVYIDPTSDLASQLMPNHFGGKSLEGEDFFLENHGAVLVQLSSGLGQELQIAEGYLVVINIPLGSFDQGAAAPVLPLYTFDENLGYWLEEGEAVLNGGFYTGSVSHFTFWMCPYYYDHYFLSGSLMCQTEVLPYTEVQIYNLWGAYLGSDISNAGGGFSGMIPEIITFDLVVIDPCGSIAYSQSIGPFTDDTNLEPVNVCSGIANYSTISGALLDCDNDAYQGGVARVQSDGIMHLLPTNNQAEVYGSVLFCNGSSSFSVMGLDLDTGESSGEQSYLIEEEVDFGSLSICGEVSEFVQFTLDGSEYYFTDNDFANINGVYNPGNDDVTLSVVGGALLNEVQFAIQLNQSLPGNYSVGGHPLAYSFLVLGNDGTDFLDVNVAQSGSELGSIVSGFIENTTFHDAGGNPHNLQNCTFRIEIDFIVE